MWGGWGIYSPNHQKWSLEDCCMSDFTPYSVISSLLNVFGVVFKEYAENSSASSFSVFVPREYSSKENKLDSLLLLMALVGTESIY